MIYAQKIIKVGNSLAVTIPKEIVKEYGLKPGDKIQTYCYDDVFVIRLNNKKGRLRSITNDELTSKLHELERRYGELYQDLADMRDNSKRTNRPLAEKKY